ncbi:hypothetical protein GJ496_009735 [Pomphorhynchus laevis]|nr:hypothetical protein GJ496_009735 [Pomphorhynchus laevis]
MRFRVLQALEDMRTFNRVVIKDMKLSVAKYADAKYEFLSYCLKAKEMEEEENIYFNFGEPLYRVDTGNYQYRY